MKKLEPQNNKIYSVIFLNRKLSILIDILPLDVFLFQLSLRKTLPFFPTVQLTRIKHLNPIHTVLFPDSG